MSNIDYKSFLTDTIEWYTKQLKWDYEQIEWYTKQLKRTREEDREFIEWVMANPNYTSEEKEANKSYASSTTRDYTKWRNYYYKQRKRDRAQLAFYESELAKLA